MVKKNNKKPKNPFSNKFLLAIIPLVFLTMYSFQVELPLNEVKNEIEASTTKAEGKDIRDAVLNTSSKETEISFSKLISEVKSGKVKSLILKDNTAEGIFKDGTSFKTEVIYYDGFLELLASNNVETNVKKESAKALSWASGLNIFSTILWIALILFIFKSMKGAGKMSIDKPRVKEASESKIKKTFADVKGVEQAKEDVQEIVEFLKDPKKFTRIGGRVPKGILLVGPPGTGKTLLARAIAGEANVPFFSISGSDFVEMFVGVGASRVRNLFAQGLKNAPCIIFIDEIDAVGRHRGAGYGGGSDEREQTLNQLLVEMDGFAGNEGVILIAATNRADVLDKALLRPGRFDRQVYVPLPDLKGREDIISVHMKKVKTVEGIDIRVIAKGTPGFSGAELENLVNEAALLAARNNQLKVEQKDFDMARDKILMGSERRSMSMTKDVVKNTAYHEAGHALVSALLPHTDPIHKVTIIPRGMALGMVQQLPESDKVSESLKEIKAHIAIYLAGRVAEETMFGKESVTTGASSDIKGATYYARNAVVKWGLSEKLGKVYYEEASLGYHEADARKNISDKTAEAIDNEVKSFIDEGYKTAKTLITKNKDKLINIAEALIKYETLSGKEVEAIVSGKTLRRTKEKKVEDVEVKPSLPVSSSKKNDIKTSKKSSNKSKTTKTKEKLKK
ncbi:MAG: ATP-dependent zinc metalloprotease FtsH [Alphaproteobacteria bacterium]|jgi:cell division protease FtsH|nr:ATP-dependent zinc metalloprotease FtsH [Alphaproteobacteria bacterium]